MNLSIRKASVRWKYGVNSGRRAGSGGGAGSGGRDGEPLRHGRLSLGLPLKHSSRTDPAELMAAAHASSFSVALSNELGPRASAAGRFLITATVTLEHRMPAGWTIMNVHLNVLARLPKVTQGRFIDATVRAKTRCLVSRSLRANISMNAKLEN